MAALDFPNSPTTNQQYAAPNGVTYQWDGAAWVVTGGPPGQLWTGTATALTPTDQTKIVTVPAGQVQLGTQTGKARFAAINTALWTSLSINRDVVAGTQDDTSKPSWQMLMRSDSDLVNIARSPAGGTPTAVLTIDNAGNLTVGTPSSTILTTVATSTNVSFIANNNPFAPQVAANASYALIFDGTTGGDTMYLVRRAPNAASGATTTLFSINGKTTPAGDLTISGNNATKNTGTVWINPSDPRLKQDVAPYDKGLAEVCQLEPISYHLKTDPDGSLCYGFDAAAVKDIFPECVSTMMLKLDPADEEAIEVLTFDMHPILVALVNALKELAAQVTHA